MTTALPESIGKIVGTHDTWQAAHLYLMGKATHRLEEARRDLGRAQSFLGNVKGLRKPEQS